MAYHIKFVLVLLLSACILAEVEIHKQPHNTGNVMPASEGNIEDVDQDKPMMNKLKEVLENLKIDIGKDLEPSVSVDSDITSDVIPGEDVEQIPSKSQIDTSFTVQEKTLGLTEKSDPNEQRKILSKLEVISYEKANPAYEDSEQLGVSTTPSAEFSEEPLHLTLSPNDELNKISDSSVVEKQNQVSDSSSVVEKQDQVPEPPPVDKEQFQDTQPATPGNTDRDENGSDSAKEDSTLPESLQPPQQPIDSTIGEDGATISATVESNLTEQQTVTGEAQSEILSETGKEAKTEDITLETYSQFAERITAQNRNGEANGASQSAETVQKRNRSSKVKTKNYASLDCGAKLISSNPEAQYASRTMDTDKDMYLLNQCIYTTWVVYELCESIRPQKFSVANFELFSSSPKDILVWGSYRSPGRDWILLGSYVGEEGSRAVQTFPIETNEFVKYVKLEITSHYGSEYYCPVSTFQIHGISEFDVIDHMDYDTDDQEEEPTTTPPPKRVGWSLTSLLRSVVGYIRRGSVPDNSTTALQEDSLFSRDCNSIDAAYAIQDNQCILAESLNYIMSCYRDEYETLLKRPLVKASVSRDLCELLAQNLCTAKHVPDKYIYKTVCSKNYVCTMLSPRHVLAMCHMLNRDILHSITPRNADSLVHIDSSLPMYLNQSGLSSNSTSDCLVPKNTLANNTIGSQDTKPSSPKVPTLQKTSENRDNSSPPVENITEVKPNTKKQTSTHDQTKMESDSSKGQNVPMDVDNGTHQSQTETKMSPPNKESIVVRLSNKIKVLEHNMSINSQYLEELSRRFKQHMEDMQTQINETTKVVLETRTKYKETTTSIQNIEIKLDRLTQIVEGLVQDREDIISRLLSHHCVFLVVELLVFFILFTCCGQSGRGPTPTNVKPAMSSPVKVATRKMSMDSSSRMTTPSLKHRKRRPSDGALTFSDNYNSMIRDQHETKTQTLQKTSSTSSFFDKDHLVANTDKIGGAGVIFSSARQDKSLMNHSSLPSNVVKQSAINVSPPPETTPGQVQWYLDDNQVPYYGGVFYGKFYEFTNNGTQYQLPTNYNIENLTGCYHTPEFGSQIVTDYDDTFLCDNISETNLPSRPGSQAWFQEDPIDIPPSPLPIANKPKDMLQSKLLQWCTTTNSPSPIAPGVNGDVLDSCPVPQSQPTKVLIKSDKPKKKKRKSKAI